MGNGPTPPAYLGVMNLLRERINRLEPGTALPAIRELAEEYNVGDGIVRRALEKLRDSEGLLTSQQGQRFSVATPTAPEPDDMARIMQRFDDLTAEMRTLAERVTRLEQQPLADSPAPTALPSRPQPHPASP